MPASISPLAQQATTRRKLEGSFSLKELLAALYELERDAQIIERMVQSAKTQFNWWAVGTVASFIVLLFAWNLFAWNYFPPLLLVPIVLLYFAIRAYLKWKAQQARLLCKDFEKCVKGVLETLGTDISANDKIKVSLDLSGITDAKKKPPRNLPPGHFRKLTETVIEDPWCNLRLPLFGGGIAVVAIRNDFRKLDRRYVSSSGKFKSKTKWVKHCTVTAMLVPGGPVEWREELRPPANPATEKFKFVDKEGVRAPRLEHCSTYKGAAAPADSPPAREVVGLLLRLQALRAS